VKFPDKWEEKLTAVIIVIIDRYYYCSRLLQYCCSVSPATEKSFTEQKEKVLSSLAKYR
jgi:hypothetical protein